MENLSDEVKQSLIWAPVVLGCVLGLLLSINSCKKQNTANCAKAIEAKDIAAVMRMCNQ